MADDRVTVFDPGTAQYVTVPREQLAQAAAYYGEENIETPEQTALRKEREQFDTLGQTALAGVEGVASGASMGGYDVAAEQLGFGEDVARRKRLAPIVRGGGELGGSLLGLGKLKAASTVGKAAAGATNILSAPARAAVSLGRGAETLAGAGAARLGLGATGQSVARLGLGGAAEGALFGAGQAVSESALAGGDYEGLAERVIAGGGSGALFGLGAGTTLGLVGSGTSALGKLLGRKAKLSDEALNEQTIRAMGLRGSDVQKLGTQAKIDQIATHVREYRLADGRRLIDPFDTAEDIASKVDIARKETGGKLGSLRETASRAGGQIDVRGYLQRVDTEVLEKLRNDPMPEIRANARKVERGLERLRKRTEAFDSGQRGLDDIAEKIEANLAAARGIDLPPQTRALLAEVRAAAKAGVATELHAASLASDVLAPIARSAPSSEAQKASAELMNQLDVAGRNISAPVTYDDLLRQQKSMQAVIYKKPVKGSGLSIAAAHTEDLSKAERILEDTLEAHVERTLARVDPTKAGEYVAARKLSESMITASGLGRKITKQNLGNRFASPSDHWVGVGTLAGMLAGDVTGLLGSAVIGGAAAGINKLVRERGNSFLVSMADRARMTDSKISQSIAKFIRGASDVRRIAVGQGGATEAESVLGKMRNESTLEAARRVTAALQAGPQHESAAADEFAPETGKAVNAKTARVYSFLQNKIPPPLVAPSSPLYPKLAPHPSEIEKFARYYQAATQPLSVLDKLETGQLAPEHIEAIRECWPKLFEQIQTKVSENLLQVERLPPGKRFQLGALLDVATDPALEQSALQHAQDSYAAQPAQAQPPPNTPPAKPIAKSFQGEAERLEAQELAI